MDNKIKSLVKSNYVNFPKWDSVFKEFVQATYLDYKFDNEKHTQIIINTKDMLNDIVQIFIQAGKFKEDWSELFFNPYPFGINTVIRAEKISSEFQFGVDGKGFFLESYIDYPENIKYMSDGFWTNILKLSELSEFEFVENTSVSSAEAKRTEKMFEGKKSHLFRFIRNYFILELYEEDLVNIGSFSARWSPSISWDKLIDAGSQAFKILYKTNYSLWRVGYLSEQRKQKTNDARKSK